MEIVIERHPDLPLHAADMQLGYHVEKERKHNRTLSPLLGFKSMYQKVVEETTSPHVKHKTCIIDTTCAIHE